MPFFTAERDESGNLTEDGLAAAQQATYGSGTFSLLGPTVGGLVEFGNLINFCEVNNDHYISFLSAGSDEITTDYKMLYKAFRKDSTKTVNYSFDS